MIRGIRLIYTRYFFLFLIFITGAAVLILEVTATRILSTYFGNTIYSVSSVLSVILLALSLGYFAGGRMADKWGSSFLFFLLVTLSAIGVFILQLSTDFLLPEISRQYSIREGPLVASALLFFLPSFFLGMLSPLVIKLQKGRLKAQGIGKTSGDVFFWSTLGSIAGSLGAGFYLIPSFGLRQIIFSVGVVLLIIGFSGALFSRQKNTGGLKIVMLFLTLPFLHLSLTTLDTNRVSSPTVFFANGLYDSIHIYDGEVNYQKARFLQQSTDASSAMYLNSPELVYDYTKYYSVYKLVNKHINNALVIGGGAYSVPKALLADDQDVIVDVAEVEPDLYTIGKKYFKVPADPRLRNHIEDGRRFLQDTDTKYELIFSDAFHFSIPAHMTTQEFFVLSREKLKPNGVFVANIIGSLNEQQPSFLLSEMKTFQSVYPNSYFFAVLSPTSHAPQNIIMVGYNAPEGRDLLSVDTEDAFLARLSEYRVDPADYKLDACPVFTDNFAPVEYYLSKRLSSQED